MSEQCSLCARSIAANVSELASFPGKHLGTRLYQSGSRNETTGDRLGPRMGLARSACSYANYVQYVGRSRNETKDVSSGEVRRGHAI